MAASTLDELLTRMDPAATMFNMRRRRFMGAKLRAGRRARCDLRYMAPSAVHLTRGISACVPLACCSLSSASSASFSA
jgi:hypothetical protein